MHPHNLPPIAPILARTRGGSALVSHSPARREGGFARAAVFENGQQRGPLRRGADGYFILGGVHIQYTPPPEALEWRESPCLRAHHPRYAGRAACLRSCSH